MPRGGKRSGAGRPVSDRSVPVTVRLSQCSADILKSQVNQSRFVEELIQVNEFLKEFRSKYNPALILDYLESLEGGTPTEQGLVEYQQQADNEYNNSVRSGQDPVMPKRDFDGSDIVGLMSQIKKAEH